MSRRILVVDDDRPIAATLQRHLTSSGFQCWSAGSAEEALSLLNEVDPDLVITDIWMPGMDGLDLLEHIRGAMVEVDVIVITAHEDMPTAIRAMKAGAYDYLVKPLDLDQMLDLTAGAEVDGVHFDGVDLMQVAPSQGGGSTA